jgi:NADH-quinone oxidoreductase subunit G
MFALKLLLESLGSNNIDCRQDGAKLDASVRASYIFNTTIAGIEQADVCLLIGVNPRREAAIINARLRKRYLKGGFTVYNIGSESALTYPVEQLGNNPAAIDKAVALLQKHSRPMLIIGQGALAREDGAQIMRMARELAQKTGVIQDGWNGFNVLHNAAARVAGLDMGFVPTGKNSLDVAAIAGGKAELVYLLAADEVDVPEGAFVVYQGHHGDRGAHRADVIFPGAAYTEKHGTYVNTEGRAQLGLPAVLPPGEAKEDWKIIRALSGVIGRKLPFDSLAELRAVMIKAVPSLGKIDQIIAADWCEFGADGNASTRPFDPVVKNFYMTNAISRASSTMAECVRAMEDSERKVA